MPRHRISGINWLAHYNELIRFWTRKTGSRGDVEDATHDVITKLLESNVSTISSPRSYLHSSIRNRLTDSYRQNKILDLVPIHDLPEDSHPLQPNDPVTHTCTMQLLTALKEALQELPLKCRQVFIWHRLEGYSQTEIAEKLDISVNMVEKYMIRATRHLRDRLQDHIPD
ncbi:MULTISPECIES: RNA polymerase sigma factor [Nitrosomonas]|uniref:Putative sigma-70 factor, ECF subfamily n=2 Tax=Nitrosomonas europaea TaxID=915 RepID=Q82W77_NITEU|nr:MULTISPECIES: sigma-70 family RNA polymerase sigma factor [Nitrosomonas]CAD84729.1 putative sigma-70 factor, ECF subfamily [Nitrosomonas europaea ATCC 19718]SDW15357.1 RNA polymerase sigma-70 factor, ECF subfamily [Nitrosomonas europaea]SET33702.1 RNA polymerase sigma-70 factor, ECF subfamily [Nitrosomonas europaea]SJZ35314.1 RNA polymerase sigma-70 factor, ECF subfamily [Nitrosomonas europaea]HBF25282.1 RNA polymerase ECF-subfamily sigma-70 factor [Nitrosomonas sp.]